MSHAAGRATKHWGAVSMPRQGSSADTGYAEGLAVAGLGAGQGSRRQVVDLALGVRAVGGRAGAVGVPASGPERRARPSGVRGCHRGTRRLLCPQCCWR